MAQEVKASEQRLADALTAIFKGYVEQTRERVPSGITRQKWRHSKDDPPPSVQSLEHDLRVWLKEFVTPRSAKYIVKASAGQMERRYALIPYAMLLLKDVTTSPMHGIYVALLFDEACEKVSVTLNQGIAQFRERFSLRHSEAALKQAAHILANTIPKPPTFNSGSTNLNASYPYGRSYEVGSIFFRDFRLQNFDTSVAAEFVLALEDVLRVYEAVPLKTAQDPSFAGNLQEAEDDEKNYQAAVNKKAASKPRHPLIDAPKPAPTRINFSNSSTFRRDPLMAAEALRAAQHRCEANCACDLFVATATGKPYVEAHHLIPLNQQDNFSETSLDVPANIVALCANCHARIHHAVRALREPLITRLHAMRLERLQKCGIECALAQLKKMYFRS